ncbi:MAG: cobalamin biosynthesis protein [bacterium]|nr:cobalamin biosynthesis protein [bacterium]
MIQTMIAVLAALTLDYLLGEPKRWHPLVGFGQLASWVEQKFNVHESAGMSAGLLAAFILIAPLTLLTYLIASYLPVPISFEMLILYLALGGRSLVEHADQVHHALVAGNTNEARRFTGYLVSRDTSNMCERDMSRATIESTLENGCDAVFAPLFWFLIGGTPAALCYRLANTLDAMWGYRTKRYVHWGWAAARFDDVLGFIPARLTAFTYALAGHFNDALSCWRAQASSWKSPNAGPVMSSGAGALTLQLGGPASYHGNLQERPVLGKGLQPGVGDINRATRLLQRGMLVWSGIALAVAGGLSLA